MISLPRDGVDLVLSRGLVASRRRWLFALSTLFQGLAASTSLGGGASPTATFAPWRRRAARAFRRTSSARSGAWGSRPRAPRRWLIGRPAGLPALLWPGARVGRYPDSRVSVLRPRASCGRPPRRRPIGQCRRRGGARARARRRADRGGLVFFHVVAGTNAGPPSTWRSATESARSWQGPRAAPTTTERPGPALALAPSRHPRGDETHATEPLSAGRRRSSAAWLALHRRLVRPRAPSWGICLPRRPPARWPPPSSKPAWPAGRRRRGRRRACAVPHQPPHGEPPANDRCAHPPSAMPAGAAAPAVTALLTAVGGVRPTMLTTAAEKEKAGFNVFIGGKPPPVTSPLAAATAQQFAERVLPRDAGRDRAPSCEARLDAASPEALGARPARVVDRRRVLRAEEGEGEAFLSLSRGGRTRRGTRRGSTRASDRGAPGSR